MQSKGIVRFFLIALTVVCLFQFLLVIPTNRIEGEARDFANQQVAANPKNSWSTAYASYLDNLSDKTVFSLPLIKDYTYQDLKKSQLAMGLDLKGGMSVLLQVDLSDFLKSLSGNSQNPNFQKALVRAAELQKTEQADYITLFARAWKEVGEGQPLASLFASSGKSDIKANSPDADVVNILRTLANGTVKETYGRLKQRIDKLGVVQPNVSLDAARDLIQVELPGIDNPARAREMLQGQAKLEFWETFRLSDNNILQTLVDVDNSLKAGAASTAPVVKDTIYEFPVGANGLPDSTKEKVQRIVDRPADQTAGPLLSILQLNAQGGGATIGYAEKGKRAFILDTILSRADVASKFPSDLAFRWARKPVDNAEGASSSINGMYELFAVKKRNGEDKAPLDGDVVLRAGAQPDPSSGEITVSLSMNNDGARTWADMTTRAANNGNREVAILLDDAVVSAPRVINPIMGGNTQITGGFSMDEATDLSQILEVGKLPARAKIVQESQVGPSLGAENINKSLITMILCVLFLCAFMVAYYNKGGWVSVVALLANVFFILGTLASLGTVLTLPGIAGIVLTLATAVDANVVIYERIREELRNGLGMLQAMRTGFTRALSAIVDANVTLIITACVLIYFGLGPIKGFGTVLLIGVLCSMFTAVLVGRYLSEWWMEKGNDLNYSRPWSEKWLVGINYDWIGKRKYAYMFSLAITVLGIVSYMSRGFELGVDFKGGYSFNVQFDKPVEIEALRTPLTAAFGGNPVIKAVSTENTYNITTSYLINEQGGDVVDRVLAKLHEGVTAAGYTSELANFKNTNGSGTHITTSSQVSATVADDIRNSSFKASAWALGLIFIFLLIRFRRWQFSLGAVIALFHDVLITLTFFTLLHGIVPFSLEIDQAIIACILTVIGYSVNDTVIVYDRIREFMGTFAGRRKEDVFNLAINTTLNRTLITSGTVFIVVLLLFLFGGSAIRGFAFGMLVGVIFGTYSSIFVASSLVVDFLKEDYVAGKSVEAPKAATTSAPAKKAAKA
jgi:SecD/SecF fusion protein